MNQHITNKSAAMLDLYFLLNNNKYVSLDFLLHRYNRSERSIHRYIEALEDFINASERALDDNAELSKINYLRHKGVYTLITPQVDDHTAGLLSMLIQIKSLTPYLSKETIEFIKSTYKTHNIKTHYVQSFLKDFEIDQEIFPVLLLEIQEIIMNQLRMSITYYDAEGDEIEERGLTPIRISYQYYHFYLHYYYKGEVKSLRLIDIIQVKQYGNKEAEKEFNTKSKLILEIDAEYYKTFKEENPVIKTEYGRTSNGNYKVAVNMTEEDVYFLCYRVFPRVKILEPIEYVECFKNKMKGLYMMYEDVE
ncbi:WYL domain-containing protein [Macrococcus equi]|uniref:WYL domain-containing protein n=1 Tax=Macrococcus equi TaxID=3395462 RepID=UPI0039BDE9B4